MKTVREGRCPYTRSGEWPDEGLLSIIESALEGPNPECPDCKTEVVTKGYGELAWSECSKCGRQIGDITAM